MFDKAGNETLCRMPLTATSRIPIGRKSCQVRCVKNYETWPADKRRSNHRRCDPRLGFERREHETKQGGLFSLMRRALATKLAGKYFDGVCVRCILVRLKEFNR